MALSFSLIQYCPHLVTFAIDNTFSQTDKRFSISDNIIIYIMLDLGAKREEYWRRYWSKMETLLDIPPTLTSVHINPHTCFSYLSSTPCSRVHTYMRQPSRTSICQGVGWAYLANMGSRGRATSRKWEWISGTESSLYPRRESGIPERESTLASRPPVQESNTYFWQFIPNVGSRWMRRPCRN